MARRISRWSMAATFCLAAVLHATLGWTDAGSLDLSFGRGGKVLQGLYPAGGGFAASVDEAAAVAFDSEGRIAAAGTLCQGYCLFWVARFTEGGAIAFPFGVFGVAVASFPGDAVATSMAIDHAGRIVVAGFHNPPESSSGLSTPPLPSLTSQIALARVLPNGALDESFGQGGMVLTEVSREASQTAEAVVIDRQGRIVVAGRSVPEGTDSDFTLLRYRENGTLDPTFGNGGIKYTDKGGNEGAMAIAIDRLDRIVVSGYATQPGDPGDSNNLLVVRYTPDGVEDRLFGSDHTGTVYIDNAGWGRALAIDLTDRIFVFDTSECEWQGGASAGSDCSFLTRLTADGTARGTWRFFLDEGDPDDSYYGQAQAYNLAIDSSNRIVISGASDSRSNRWIVARIRSIPQYPELEVDRTFGVDGFSLADFNCDSAGLPVSGAGMKLAHVAIDPRGKIVVAGRQCGDIALARFQSEAFEVGAPRVGCLTCSFAPTCGDGVVALSEECDDGNGSPGDGCSASCTIEPDDDHDALYGADDYCVNVGGAQDFLASPRPRLEVGRVGTDTKPGNDTYSFSGQFKMPAGWSFERFDPNQADAGANGGVTIVITSAVQRQKLSALLYGSYSGAGTFGWRKSGRTWTFVGDPRNPDHNGVSRMTITDQGGGRLAVTVTARNATALVPSTVADPPQRAIVVLGRTHGAGQRGECAESRFSLGECAWNAAGTAVTCRR